jgi:hypothetical protein
MSRKSSLPQDPKSVSVALMPDTLKRQASRQSANSGADDNDLSYFFGLTYRVWSIQGVSCPHEVEQLKRSKPLLGRNNGFESPLSDL